MEESFIFDLTSCFLFLGTNSCSVLEQKNHNCLVQEPEDGEKMEHDWLRSTLCCRDLDFFSFQQTLL